MAHVISVDVKSESRAHSLAARFPGATAERFRADVVHNGTEGWAVEVTAMDASRTLAPALLRCVRRWLEEEDIESTIVHLCGRSLVLGCRSPAPARVRTEAGTLA